jgi:hypothetical protein
VSGFFDWNMRAARWTLCALIYLLPIMILISFGIIYSIFFVHISAVVAFWLFIAVSVMFTALWIIGIFDYKKSFTELKAARAKYGDSLSLDSVDKLISLCTKCREMCIWNFVGLFGGLAGI